MSGPQRALLAVLGVIMLLPGFCAFVVAATIGLGNAYRDLGGVIFVFWAICFLISGVGIFILYKARRREIDRQPNP